MTQTSISYGRILYELSVLPQTVEKARKLTEASEETRRFLESPIVSLDQKEKVIKRLFPREIWGFLTVVCKYGHAGLLPEMFRAYQEYYNQQNHILTAALYYVTPPTKEQLEGIKKFLCSTCHTKDADIEMIEDKSLVGGFIIRAGEQEFDYSLKGRIQALQQKLSWR
ncbi:MAG TPA: ATP synthase F1 subunit delta [Candidatus Blautia pullicola]|uniref:ATP synthase subunit delta n=1 Tax=Candidatus Blautia pullicola TaxID=2838498 RepID=A0A9D2JTD4_9FIRM|nr:ATP synthase F1 subunit delta [Candidatus Blautia pullicola]